MLATQQYSLQFSTAQQLCQFIRQANLRNFLLLGKKSMLIATLSEAMVELAINEYGAVPAEEPEPAHRSAGVMVVN